MYVKSLMNKCSCLLSIVVREIVSARLCVQDCVCKIVCARLSVQDCLCKIVREIFQARLSVEVVCEEEEDWVKLSSKRCPVGLEDLQVGLLSVWAGQSRLVECLGRAELACSVSGPGRVGLLSVWAGQSCRTGQEWNCSDCSIIVRR